MRPQLPNCSYAIGDLINSRMPQPGSVSYPRAE